MQNNRSTRAAESRVNEMITQYNMEYVSPLDLPPGVAKEGYTYYWANREEGYQVESLAAQGWQLVPSDRAPAYAIDPLKRNPMLTQYFCYKDVILMEIPTIFCQRGAQRFNNHNERVMRSLQGVENDFSSFASPIRGISTF